MVYSKPPDSKKNQIKTFDPNFSGQSEKVLDRIGIYGRNKIALVEICGLRPEQLGADSKINSHI